MSAYHDAIVVPARAGTGLRHVVVLGEERALCGVDVADWYMEAKPFDPKTIGCKRCKAAYAKTRDTTGAK